MRHTRFERRASSLTTGLALLLGACSQQDGSTQALPSDVESIVFLQRTARNSNGNVFDYTSYEPGARLVKLQPPSADGQLTVLTADAMFAGADIMSWDLSFDAKSIVFSARLAGDDHYHLFTMGIDGTNPKQITAGPYQYVYPIHLPGQQVLFTTSKNVEAEAAQFQDEYERQTTAQIGTISLDGTGEQLGPRNVSHRVAPALMPDGNVIYTEWRHLGDVNDGHLRFINTDMTRVREAFGSEAGASGGANSYLRARYVDTYRAADGRDAYRVVAVATSRDRTLQAGKLLLIDLDHSEATSRYRDLTPAVPMDNAPSTEGVGRYYDAEPVGAPANQKFLVSWANGPVESELLAMASTKADFGLYVLDGRSGKRFPVYNDPAYWDVQARPVKARPEPAVTASAVSGDDFLVAAINVYQSTARTIPAGQAVKVRLIEGFSGEEGIPTFGSTEFDGQSRYGEVPVKADGSFAARVPANVPLHMQIVDKFGVSIADEPVWISGRAGEQRTCGGCHEDRTRAVDIMPGQIDAVLAGAVNLVVPRPQRVSMNYSYDSVRGVPWDLALQPVFDAKCASCHDGDESKPGNKGYTVVDMTSMISQRFVFDLRGQKLPVTVGERMTGLFTASYLSIMGLGEMLGENVITYENGMPVEYAQPANAAESLVIQKLNPPQRFPAVDPTVRRYPGRPVHPVDVGGTELTPDEYYLLILNIDMGGQFFFRENKDGAFAAYGDPQTMQALMGGK